MTRLYKWMLPGLITPTQKKKWPVAVGEWTPIETPVLCESGWHGVEEKDVLQHLPSQIGAELWVVEVKGKRVEGNEDFCVEQMKLVECIGTTTEQNLRLFACDVAEDALSLIDNPDPRSVKAIEVSRRYANGEATKEELTAARDAAWAAAWDARDAAWVALDAAGVAARAAARDAARVARDAAWVALDAAGVAARAAARDAARDAAWVARDAAGDAAGDAAWAKYSNWLVVRAASN